MKKILNNKPNLKSRHKNSKKLLQLNQQPSISNDDKSRIDKLY